MHDLDKAKCDTCQRKMMMMMMMMGNNESELMFGYINYTCRSQEVFKEMCDRFIGTV